MNSSKNFIPLFLIISIINILLLSNQIFGQNDKNKLISEKRIEARDLYNSGHYYKAEKTLNELIELKKLYKPEDAKSLANSYLNLGIIYKLTYRTEKALELYGKSEYIYKNLDYDPGRLATTYYNISSLYLNKSDYYKAKIFLKKSISILDTINIPFFFDEQLIYVMLGSLDLNNDDFESAMAYFNKAIEKTTKKSKLRNRIYERILYAFINYYDVLKYKSIIEKYLSVYRSELSEMDTQSLIHYYLLSGQLKFMINNRDQNAIKDFLNAYELMNDSFSRGHPLYIDIFNNIVNYYYENGNYFLTLDYIHKAFENLIDDTLNDNLEINPDPSKINDFEPVINLLRFKILSLYNLYKNENNINYLINAKESSEYTLNLVEQLKWKYDFENHKYYISETETEIFKIAENIYFSLFEITKENKYILRAFEVNERSKAFSLLINLRAEQAMTFGGIPDQLIENESEIIQKVSTFTELILEEKKDDHPDIQKIKTWENSLFKLNNQHDQLIRFFETNYPEYYRLKYDTRVISPKDVQKKLKKDEALIEYSLSDSMLFTYLITRNGIDVYRQETDSSFRDLCLDYYEVLTKQSFSYDAQKTYTTYTRKAYRLYEKLLKPLNEKIEHKNLIVIPDEEISFVSFESLITKPVDSLTINYHTLPYLLRKNGFSSSFSATVHLTESLKDRNPQKSVLAFAPTYENLAQANKGYQLLRKEQDDEDRKKLIRIPGVMEEVENLSAFIPADIFMDTFALESNFKANASDYRILHLAMHTILDHDDPMYSKLAFTQLVDSADDGFLHTYEIYNLQLNADLAVLSSCNSGYGTLQEGEGIQSLARSFAYAGCPSIVMTLWEVADQSTIDLMGYFYKYLSMGFSKSESLHRAKIDFLDNADMLKSNPFFWSSFVLVGNTDPVFHAREETLMINSGLLILPLIILLIYYYQYRKKLRIKLQGR